MRTDWHYEIVPLTHQRGRIVRTDGEQVSDGW